MKTKNNCRSSLLTGLIVVAMFLSMKSALASNIWQIGVNDGSYDEFGWTDNPYYSVGEPTTLFNIAIGGGRPYQDIHFNLSEPGQYNLYLDALWGRTGQPEIPMQIRIWVNNVLVDTVSYPAIEGVMDLPPKVFNIPMQLDAGFNTITLEWYNPGQWGWIAWDYLALQTFGIATSWEIGVKDNSHFEFGWSSSGVYVVGQPFSEFSKAIGPGRPQYIKFTSDQDRTDLTLQLDVYGWYGESNSTIAVEVNGVEIGTIVYTGTGPGWPEHSEQVFNLSVNNIVGGDNWIGLHVISGGWIIWDYLALGIMNTGGPPWQIGQDDNYYGEFGWPWRYEWPPPPPDLPLPPVYDNDYMVGEGTSEFAFRLMSDWGWPDQNIYFNLTEEEVNFTYYTLLLDILYAGTGQWGLPAYLDVRVNDVPITSFMWTFNPQPAVYEVDIHDYLLSGQNKITLRITDGWLVWDYLAMWVKYTVPPLQFSATLLDISNTPIAGETILSRDGQDVVIAPAGETVNIDSGIYDIKVDATASFKDVVLTIRGVEIIGDTYIDVIIDEVSVAQPGNFRLQTGTDAVRAFEIKVGGIEGIQFLTQIHYTDADLDAWFITDESMLNVYHYDSASGLWVQVPEEYIVRDPVSNTISALTGSLSPFAVGLIVYANVTIEPETLNLSSEGVFTAFVEFPGVSDFVGEVAPESTPASIADIDISTVECEGARAISGKINEDGVMVIKFWRSHLVDIEPEDSVNLTISGDLLYGGSFVGSDTIRVISKGNRDRTIVR